MGVSAARVARLPNWLVAAVPFVVIALLVVGFVALDPIARLREAPPVEALAVERAELDPGRIALRVRNDGPDPVEISQVLVNDAYWNFSIDDKRLGRLEAARVDIDYPWDEGLPVEVGLVTSTGVVIAHEIEAATLTPESDAQSFLVYGLLGLYIGVIPVAIGLLWFPSLQRARERWLNFFLAFTVGLLVFLLLDTVVEGLELAERTAGVLNGSGLFATGAIGAVLGLLALEAVLEARGESFPGLALAYLIALGIGLHNMGEGLAVGAALATGEIALGTFLVVGFAIHNTTEGLAIVSPLGRVERRPSLKHFVALGALAGVPTIAGAWAGGFAFSPAWGAVAFGLAAGAIAQVVWAIARTMGGRRLTSGLGALGLVAGLVVMYVTGLLTA